MDSLQNDGLIKNIENQNVKECPRIDKWMENYKNLGGFCKREESGFSYKKFNGKINNVIKTYNDHRMAMAWSLYSIKNSLTIDQSRCVKKNWPNYYQDMKKLGLQINQLLNYLNPK